MTLKKLAEPAELAVSLAEAKTNLRIEQDDSTLDPLLTTYINGIVAEAEHQTGMCFINRPMRVTLDRFPDAIRLAAPTFSVESVKFFDPDGAEQTLDPQDYYADKVTEPGYVVPGSGRSWPRTACGLNVVSVDFIAGHGPDSASTPACVKLYVLARLAQQWDPADREFKDTEPSRFIERLLDPMGVYG
jgi:uncharacterized phiE125 gp8 family phage protein